MRTRRAHTHTLTCTTNNSTNLSAGHFDRSGGGDGGVLASWRNAAAINDPNAVRTHRTVCRTRAHRQNETNRWHRQSSRSSRMKTGRGSHRYRTTCKSDASVFRKSCVAFFFCWSSMLFVYALLSDDAFFHRCIMMSLLRQRSDYCALVVYLVWPVQSINP